MNMRCGAGGASAAVAQQQAVQPGFKLDLMFPPLQHSYCSYYCSRCGIIAIIKIKIHH